MYLSPIECIDNNNGLEVCVMFMACRKDKVTQPLLGKQSTVTLCVFYYATNDCFTRVKTYKGSIYSHKIVSLIFEVKFVFLR